MGDQIMTVTEVAQYLKVNDRTVYRMAASGEIPAFKVGASWRFKPAELEVWMLQRHNQNGRNSSEKES
jgi:excisionase family DNA binding protein